MLMTKDEQAKFEQLKALDEIRVLLTQAMIACDDCHASRWLVPNRDRMDEVWAIRTYLADVLSTEVDWYGVH